MNRFDGVIFDLDGTLLDSLEDIANAANAVLVELGRPTVAVDAYRTLVGDGVSVLIERLMPDAVGDRGLRSEAVNSFEVHYQQHWNKRSKPYDGILKMLESLAEHGIAVAVLSNKPEAFTRQCVSFFFPHVRFAWVLGHSDRFPPKPNPESAQWMAAQMSDDKDRIAYVGDTNTDMKTAVGAGLFAMGVSWGFRARQELEASGAVVVFDRPADLFFGLLGR